MGRVVAVLNRKGGVGKTTIAAHLGRAATLAGQRVLLVDADPQGTLRDWHAAADGCAMELVAADTPASLTSIRSLKAAFDLLVIDGTAGIPVNSAAAARVADVILIPVQPCGFDLWSTHELVDLVKARQVLSDGLPHAWLVMSRVIARSTIAREVENALPELDLPILDARISQRVIFATANSEGSTVLDLAPDSPAAHEVRRLYRELMRTWQ